MKMKILKKIINKLNFKYFYLFLLKEKKYHNK